MANVVIYNNYQIIIIFLHLHHLSADAVLLLLTLCSFLTLLLSYLTLSFFLSFFVFYSPTIILTIFSSVATSAVNLIF